MKSAIQKARFRGHAGGITLVILAAILSNMGLYSTAYAASAGSGAFGPLTQALQTIVDFVTGPFGKLVATIGIVSAGISAFVGRLTWVVAGCIVLGIGLVFGAPMIVDNLSSAVGQ